MRLLLAHCCLFLSVSTLAVEVQAQSLSLNTGERIRVLAPEISADPVIGQVSALTAETLVLEMRRRGLNQLTIPLKAIERLEISQGYRRHTKKGALVGVAVAGLWWVITVSRAFFGPSCRHDRSDADCDAMGVLLLYATPLVSGAGGLVGAWGGSLIRTERWKAFSLQTRVGVAPGHGMGLDSWFSLGISVRLGRAL